MGIHIGVDLPPSDELSKRYLIHAHEGLLVLGGGGFGSALGGIGALWSFILVAQTLGARVTTGIGTANIGTGATTYETKHKNTQEKREGSMQRPQQHK